MLIWLLVLLIVIAWKYFGCKPMIITYQNSKVIKMSITESKRETVLKEIAKADMLQEKPILYNSERLKSLMISIWLQVVDYPVILLLELKNKFGGLVYGCRKGDSVGDWRCNFACPCSRN